MSIHVGLSWRGWLTFLAVLLAATLASCAHKRPSDDSAAWRACSIACKQDGASPYAVFETLTEIECVCRKPPAPVGT